MKKKTALSSKFPTPPLSPAVSKAKATISDFTIEQEQAPKVDVPQIDKNAELKIESALLIDEEVPVQEKKNSFYFIAGTITGLLIIILTIILGYLYLFSPNLNLSSSDSKIISPAPITEPSSTPTPTAIPTIAKPEITITVLNGSGKTGEAAKVSKQLETLGYKIDSLGNAPEQTGTTISFAKTIESQKELLVTDLKKEFPNATFSMASSEQKSKIQIIIGK